MNKKSIAFWKMTLFISIILSIILAYQNFESYQLTLNLWEDYYNQEIGTDKLLTNKVQNIENNLSIRENFKFIIDDHPTELSNVIVFDGYDSRFSSSSKYIFVTGIISAPNNGKRLTIARFRDKEYTLAQGDSIAGGYISSITEKEVIFNKNDKSYKFYKGLDTSLIDEDLLEIDERSLNSAEEIKNNSNNKKYSLQSGPYDRFEIAELQKKDLLAAGFKARVSENNSDEHILYIVHVGFFNDLTSAQTMQNQIVSTLNIETIIVNNN